MSRVTYRVTLIASDLDTRKIEQELQEMLERRVPEGIVEVRRTITSDPRLA